MSRTTYLDGPYTPMRQEVTAHDLAVTGAIPADLTGRYLRIGPNPVGAQDPATYHLFTGDGMVHGVRLRDGRAEWYRNRWVRSERVATALGEAWKQGPVHAHMDTAPNTHIIGHQGRTFALVEAGPRPYELDFELNTLGPSDFGGTLPGGYTAHTKRDVATGELHAVGYFFANPYLEYTVLDRDTKVSRVVPIPVPDGPMVHDLALTESYVIFYDLPVVFDLDILNQGGGLPYGWNPSHQARIGLLRRDGSTDVTWIDIDPCWVFHTLNAYDEDGRVVLDLAVFPSFLNGGRLDGNPPPYLARWTIDPAAGKVGQETVDDRPQEFPRIDERLTGRRHRYGYTVSGDALLETRIGEAVFKHDYVSGRSERRDFPAGAGIGEAVFVPRAESAGEDDGYLMTLVRDGGAGTSDLVILSAQDLTGDPVAVVHLPVTLPLGFHGSWVPDA